MKRKPHNRPKTNVLGYELTNSFFQISQLKARIQMLTKPTSPRHVLWQYALVLPFAGVLFMCTQAEKEMDTLVKGQEKLDQSLKLNQVQGEIFAVVEKPPVFEGDMPGLTRYLSEHIKYPAAAERANVQGRVFVNFVVTKTGDIADVHILKGIGFGCDEEAIRVVSRMPRWKPATQNGVPVNVRYNLPIAFELEPGALSKAKSLGVKNITPENGNRPTFDSKEISVEQTRDLVKGQVVGPDQKPIPGASIIVAGGTRGTTTDANGRFMINTKPDTRLTISFVGFTSQTIDVNNRKDLIIKL